MSSNTTRIPLAIAMSAALALSVGCAGDRDTATVDDNAAMTDDATMQTPPPVATTNDPAMDNDRMGMNDGTNSDQPVDDTWITTKVKSALLADEDVSGLEIEVETLNGVVTLTGEASEQMQIDEAVRIARGIEGVTDVQTTTLTMGGMNNQ